MERPAGRRRVPGLLSCATVFNAAGPPSHAQTYFASASLTALRLRATASAPPAACTSMCLRLFVEHQVHRLLRTWSGGVNAIWDSIERYPPVPPVSAARSIKSGGHVSRGYQGTERLWLLRIGALLASSEDIVMFLDSDAMPCPGWDGIVDWFVHSGLDVASSTPVVPFSGSFGHSRTPAPYGIREEMLADWGNFSERNLGFGLLRRSRPVVQELLERFQMEFVRIANDTLLPMNADQTAWRAALWWGLRSGTRNGNVTEAMISGTRVCKKTKQSLKAHTLSWGNGSCGTCSFIHHKAADTVVRISQWANPRPPMRGSGADAGSRGCVGAECDGLGFFAFEKWASNATWVDVIESLNELASRPRVLSRGLPRCIR